MLIGSVILVVYFLNISVSGISGPKTSVWNTVLTLSRLKTESTWGGRLNMYKSTAGIIRENPSLGIGLGNWRLLSPKYADNTAYTDRNFTKITQRPHNDFLWLLSEVGIIGMVFIIGFLIYHLRLLLLALKRGANSDEEREHAQKFIDYITQKNEVSLDFIKYLAYEWRINPTQRRTCQYLQLLLHQRFSC